MSDDPVARFWRGAARRLAWRVNVASCWERGLTPTIVASVLCAGALLAFRRQDVEPARVWIPFAVVLLLVATQAAWRARRRFFSETAALVELDVALRLKNRLTAASSGIGPWPPIPTRPPQVLRFRSSRLIAPPLFCVAILFAAGFIPVSKARPATAHPTEPPSAWKDADQWLRGLEQHQLAPPEAIASWEERLNRLRRQPESAWYGHASLEAGDTLHQQLEASLRSMGHDLEDAAEALDTMDSVGGKNHDGGAESGGALERAMQRLEAGAVPLHPSLMAPLKALKDRGRALSATELEKLRRRLREGAGFCRLSIHECRLGHKDCKDGRCQRRGGVGRGPGSVPLTLSAESSVTGSTRLEGVANEDLQHAALGETIGLSRTTHRVDRKGAGTMRGGEVGVAPSGGEAVWRDTLSPEEQRVLQKYFK